MKRQTNGKQQQPVVTDQQKKQVIKEFEEPEFTEF
jgi:hypothetical protein